jgi:hypothetical protein
VRQIYELIGRIVVEFVRRRYRQEIRTAAAVSVGVAAVASGAYVATRAEGEDASPGAAPAGSLAGAEPRNRTPSALVRR